MKNLIKIFAYIVIALSLGQIVTYFFEMSGVGSGIFSFFNNVNTSNFLQLTVVVLLLQTGTLIRSKYFPYILAALVITGVGILFRVLHWFGNPMILATGIISTLVIYCIHFFKKPAYKIIDILKLIWILLMLTGSFFPVVLLFSAIICMFLTLYFGIYYFLHPAQPSIQTINKPE